MRHTLLLRTQYTNSRTRLIYIKPFDWVLDEVENDANLSILNNWRRVCSDMISPRILEKQFNESENLRQLSFCSTLDFLGLIKSLFGRCIPTQSFVAVQEYYVIKRITIVILVSMSVAWTQNRPVEVFVRCAVAKVNEHHRR